MKIFMKMEWDKWKKEHEIVYLHINENFSSNRPFKGRSMVMKLKLLGDENDDSFSGKKERRRLF